VQLCRVAKAVGFSTRIGGTVHPHKLTTQLLKLALASDKYKVSLYTSTPLVKFTSSEKGGAIAETSRGTIKAGRLVLCTNAHTPHLFPADHPLKTFIYPVRIQMGLFTPPSNFSGLKTLATSYGFPEGYCAVSAGGVVVGIGASDYITANVGVPSDYICNGDESVVTPESTKCECV
jgi:glycine/D-amino acid oxidase-like deaminating enzyme